MNIHSNVFIGEESKITDYVWIFPHVVLTNDPTPPSNKLLGVTIEFFASISAMSVLLPGTHIYEDAFVGAGAIVTKDVNKETLVVGNPPKAVCSVKDLDDKITGSSEYPWNIHINVECLGKIQVMILGRRK